LTTTGCRASLRAEASGSCSPEIIQRERELCLKYFEPHGLLFLQQRAVLAALVRAESVPRLQETL
jgi:hypothetical protein